MLSPRLSLPFPFSPSEWMTVHISSQKPCEFLLLFSPLHPPLHYQPIIKSCSSLPLRYILCPIYFSSSTQTLVEVTIIYLLDNQNRLLISLFASAFVPLHYVTWTKLFNFITNSSLSYSLHWVFFSSLNTLSMFPPQAFAFSVFSN